MSSSPRFLSFFRFFACLSFIAGCSVSSSTSENASAAPVATNEPAAPAGPSCTPAVSGLGPSGIEPITIACPVTYSSRSSRPTLPTAGRFTTAKELALAFCSTEASPADVDFTKNDVVSFAYDIHAGKPALLERGTELWISTTTRTCTGETPALSAVAFAVPKSAKIAEQTCASACTPP